MTDQEENATPTLPSICGSCEFCLEGEMNPNDLRQRMYNCYRFPPIPVSIATPQGATIMNLRPNVTPDTKACGEIWPRGMEPESEPEPGSESPGGTG